MTPAVRTVVEAVHAGAVLTMHYRRDDSGENIPRFVLEPKGKPVFAPTGQAAVKTGYLKPERDGLFGEESCQTWTAGDAPPPVDAPPPFIAGSNIRDTAIPGLNVRFIGRGVSAQAVVDTAGCRLLDIPMGKALGRREVVRRVDASRLAELDWTVRPAGGFDGALVREALAQILA